jgi:hypothetical protein
MRRTVKYVGMTKDEAQRPDGLNRETFYEAVNLELNKRTIPMTITIPRRKRMATGIKNATMTLR